MPKLIAMILTTYLLDLFGCAPKPLPPESISKIYADPVAPPDKRLAVFHLGHSLVSRDMPAMLAELAGDGHSYESQLGWGSDMREHWEPDVPINGHEIENDHPRYREARDAVESGEYDVLVLTESVEIRDAIKYQDSWDYLARWTQAARRANPEIRVYFYETWHHLDDPEGWLTRLERDLGLYWEREILDRAQSVEGVAPVYVIPAGQVMARFARKIEAMGGIGDIERIDDLFRDTIHLNDLGAYLVALTHYAVIYGTSPEGLPHALALHTGEAATAPAPEVAAVMQQIVWEVVTGYPRTGVRP